MHRGLVLLLTVCAFAIAMVPRDRRAINEYDEGHTLDKTVCARHTPCAWSVYRPSVKIIEMNISNTYCLCAEGTVCQVTEDDAAIAAYVHHCRAPAQADS